MQWTPEGWKSGQGFGRTELDVLFQVHSMFQVDIHYILEVEMAGGAYGSQFGNGGGAWIAISTEWLKHNWRQVAGSYRVAFAHTVAHEMTHAWVSLTEEGNQAARAYRDMFWMRGDMEMRQNSDEPTGYGQSHDYEDALAEVVALAVSDPGALYYTRGGWGCSPPRDVGRPRREFVARYLPFVRPIR
jgi:hypothetical protein